MVLFQPQATDKIMKKSVRKLIQGFRNPGDAVLSFMFYGRSKQLSDNADQDSKYYTDNNHGGYREIQAEVLSFNFNIPGKLSKPVQVS